MTHPVASPSVAAKSPSVATKTDSVWAEAPGRLDFLGGVADYSGSLVLETPIRAVTRVELAPLAEPVARLVSATETEVFQISLDLIQSFLPESPAAWRAKLLAASAPKWALYPLGCLLFFARTQAWWPAGGLEFRVHSGVPTSMGVSSSAALEVATMRALVLLSGQTFEGTALARLAQRVENEVVGAPCGLMDQLSTNHGTPGALLPILCRPDKLGEVIPLPEGVVIVGWPSGVKHAVTDSPYATARTAAFMGKRILEDYFDRKLDFLTELTPSQVRPLDESVLPHFVSGAEFLDRFGALEDILSTVDPDRLYPVREGALSPVEENYRCTVASALLRQGHEEDLRLVGELLYQSHASYTRIGLGCPETDDMIEAVRALGPENGFYGARVSGGGSGGTVVVLARASAVERLKSLDGFPGTLIF